MNAPSAPLTVSKLTRMVKGALEAAFPPLWVEGEVGNSRISPSGHAYFILKDEACSIRCVLFRNRSFRLPFAPEDGLRVLVFARLTVYETRGDYQLVVEEMEPRGAGAARLALLQLKAKLEAEGLFSPERKRPLPVHPRRIGVVTSISGAAIHDIVSVLRKRRAAVTVVLSPALVQGEDAPASIVAALALLDAAGDVDVVIVGRGGGSEADLAAFSDERVVRAVAAHPVPVVSAVGHQIDVSLTDLAADLSAPTPSAAAEMAARSAAEVGGELTLARQRLVGAMGDRIAEERLALSGLSARLVHPRHQMEQGRIRLDEMAFRVSAAARNLLQRKKAEIARLAGMLDTLSPLGVLGRGYAILLKETGEAVRAPEDAAEGERLTAHLARGRIRVRVEK